MMDRGRVSRSEWRWVALWIAIALVVTSVPYAIGVFRSTPDRTFSGATFAVEDVYSYFAKMRQGASGEWLFHIVYTSEPHDGALFFSFHLLLGKVAALTGLALEAIYHAARLIFGAILMITLYQFVAAFTGSIAIRRIAFWLATFAGGLGWVLILSGQPTWLGSPPLDLILPEGFTFLVLYAFPHIALARTLLLLGLLWLWSPGALGHRWARRDLLIGLLVGLCWSMMALIVPFYVLVVYAALVGAFIASSSRGIDWSEVRRMVLAGAIAAIVPAYSAVVFWTNPVFAVWSRQNQVTSPHPLHYVAAYGILAGLALASLRWAWRRDRMCRRLVGWAIVVPFLLYLPFGLQRRLVESWQVPLSILATATLVRVVLPAVRRSRPVRWLTRFPRYTSSGMQRWALAGLLLVTVPTFSLLLLDQSLRVATQSVPIFRDGGELAALDWLAAQATYDDAVLSAYDTGNYLPARVTARSFIGHGPETVHLQQKRPLVEMFYDRSTSDMWREAFLREWSITYVFVGPRERALGAVDLTNKGYLHLRYDRDGYAIYQVAEEYERE